MEITLEHSIYFYIILGIMFIIAISSDLLKKSHQALLLRFKKLENSNDAWYKVDGYDIKNLYKNGKLVKIYSYKNGKVHGKVKTYFEPSTIYIEDTFFEGKLIAYKIFDSEGEVVKSESLVDLKSKET
ncbi:hypothetical protein MM239_13460 [Belliella sp. DSM 111904]|uniref:MORN repeat variant n=1 Tax=Belliella filtrata TaxID=2923435 RepID=A0ABS9V2G8_9BACT|nr:hypothetical protein [Belliella filtrata]MCH7410409.1 hypothetical protein [Belliella filtrata]